MSAALDIPSTSGSPHRLVRETDVLVVGGGIVGTSLAGFLAREGVEVAVVDAGWPAGSNTNAGSFHVQMESTFIKRFPDLIPRMEASLGLYKLATTFWLEFERELGADCEVSVSGGLMVGETEEQLGFLRRKVAREKELGLDVAFLDRSDLDSVAPYLGPSVIGAEFCAHEGKVNPLLANAAISAWARRNGATLVSGDPVSCIEQGRSGFEVTTKAGAIRASRVALAAGYGSRILASQLGFELPTVPNPLHMNITEGAAPFIKHLVTHADRPITLKQLGSGQVVIGGGWPAVMGEGGRIPRVKLSSVIGNLTLAQHIMPQIASLRVIRTWAGVNTFIDGCGALGPMASMPGLFMVIPGYPGYTSGPLTAKLASELMLGQQLSADISPWSPDRLQKH